MLVGFCAAPEGDEGGRCLGGRNLQHLLFGRSRANGGTNHLRSVLTAAQPAQRALLVSVSFRGQQVMSLDD